MLPAGCWSSGNICMYTQTFKNANICIPATQLRLCPVAHYTRHCNRLQDTATDCNRLQHIATYMYTCHATETLSCGTVYNTLQDTARHCNRLQDTVRHCKTLQDTARHCNMLQYTFTCHATETLSCGTVYKTF